MYDLELQFPFVKILLEFLVLQKVDFSLLLYIIIFFYKLSYQTLVAGLLLHHRTD